ncbi:MAG: hypothetical protein ACLP0L_01770 [Solirubrobacteraceae bacterium]
MPSQGSNINSVDLNVNELKIIGEITDPPDYDEDSSLLHIWLAQPACPEEAGAGLAIACFGLSPTATKETPGFVRKGDKFRLTVPTGVPVSGVVGTFFEGPATVSVIAVLKKGDAVLKVLQWSRIAILPEGTDPEVDSALDEAADKAAALKAIQGA